MSKLPVYGTKLFNFSNSSWNFNNFSDFIDPRCKSINDRAPVEVAIPLYGFLYPMIVLVTMVTNIFVVLVLSQPQLRTSTNNILLAMAVTESLTGLTGLPFFFYYYTMEGYVEEDFSGIPYFWCKTSQLFSQTLPTIFHTSATWLTVYLAVHRYFYVREPQVMSNASGAHAGHMGMHGDSRRTKIVIVMICICAGLLEIPRSLSMRVITKDDPNNHQRLMCCNEFAQWATNDFFVLQSWSMVFLVHAGPCVVLVFFGGLLIRTVSEAARRRRHSLTSLQGSRCSGLHATTKMLIVVISIFLITEIPAAVLFILHFCFVTMRTKMDYYPMNVALMIRNVFILISFPFNFAVYLSMSAQFRAVVRSICFKHSISSETETTNLLNLETRKITVYDTNAVLSVGRLSRSRNGSSRHSSCNNHHHSEISHVLIPPVQNDHKNGN